MSATPARSPATTVTRRDLLRGRFFGWLRGAETAPADSGADSRAEAPSPAPRTLPLLRPPGAIAEVDFVAACTRCDACAFACPHRAITAAPARLRGVDGTPIIEPMRQPCMLCADTPCIQACPSGALAPTDRVRMGTAHINPMDCLGWQGAGCWTCGERCPVPGAISRDGGRPTVSAEACTGCGMCQWVCPAPTNAVLILPTRAR